MANVKGEFHDLTGRKYGKLTVEERAEKGGRVAWKCRCECGRLILVRTDGLSSAGMTREYGCGKCRFNHHKTPEYAAWRFMINRCEVKGVNDYALYGGRGITVCDRWRQDFHAFLQDVGHKPSPKHTLDRIDSNGNYESGNVRWATWTEQAQNRRNCITVSYRGETHNLMDWARRLGLNYVTLHWRWKKGWRDDKLFSRSQREKI